MGRATGGHWAPPHNAAVRPNQVVIQQSLLFCFVPKSGRLLPSQRCCQKPKTVLLWFISLGLFSLYWQAPLQDQDLLSFTSPPRITYFPPSAGSVCLLKHISWSLPRLHYSEKARAKLSTQISFSRGLCIIRHSCYPQLFLKGIKVSKSIRHFWFAKDLLYTSSGVMIVGDVAQTDVCKQFAIQVGAVVFFTSRVFTDIPLKRY